ncbi:MAG: Rieske (2Fe-2S) protein [Gemmatimonadota bacterium]|jgi:cytochrome b6-f complex iron-sulfur subunit
MSPDRGAPAPEPRDDGPPIDRSRFLNVLLGTGASGLAAAILYPVGRYIMPPEAAESTTNSVVLSIAAEDVAPNSGHIFKFGNKPGILVRTPEGELRAFSAMCTHLECTVQYRDDLRHIWCACHNGHFDLSGRNIQGPPPSPLVQYDVHERGDAIIVSRRI